MHFGAKQIETAAVLALLLLSSSIIAYKNYNYFTTDSLRVVSDISSHAIRPQFYLENPGYVAEWYNGVDLFIHYPPASVWLLTVVYLAIGNLGLAASISVVLLEIAFVLVCSILAIEMRKDWKGGALAGLVVLASSISVGRFFNAGRYGEFFGFVAFSALMTAGYSYHFRPERKKLGAIAVLAFITSMSHVLAAIMLFIALPALLLPFVAKNRGRDIFFAAILGFAPSLLFWIPFALKSGNPSISGNAAGYLSLLFGLFVLVAVTAILIRYRNLAAFAVGMILVLWGIGKVAYYPPEFEERFEGLRMDGKYVALPEVHETVYSVLAAKGFRSSWGYYDQAADASLTSLHDSLIGGDCAAIVNYAENTDTAYFITQDTDLKKCGFTLAYKNRLMVFRR